MSESSKKQTFDPNTVTVKNDNFIGLPFTKEEADIFLLPVPWDVTTSFKPGTSRGPSNILEQSYQLDLYDPEFKDPWKIGFYFDQIDSHILSQNDKLRSMAQRYIDELEEGAELADSPELQDIQSAINEGCRQLNEWVYRQTAKRLNQGKIMGLVGGDHSTPLGFYRAIGDHFGPFGILTIDAHLDLRKAYEGFQYSHASIFYNALQNSNVLRIMHVGIRDCCEAEVSYSDARAKRSIYFFDHELKSQSFNGMTWDNICKNIVDRLPDNVVVSIDIDGLSPDHCPNTGTPVPGGLSYDQTIHLVRTCLERGKRILAFDVCEVAGDGDWDGNVGARIIYKLGALVAKSNGKV